MYKKKPSCVWLDNSSIELRIYIYSIRRIHYQWMFLPEEISQFIPWRNTMMVDSQLYRSVAVFRAQCKPGSDITCFEAIFFILSIMMSLYSKQNCNNHRDDEWNNSSYIRKDSVILRWDACYTFCVDKALLTCNNLHLPLLLGGGTTQSIVNNFYLKTMCFHWIIYLILLWTQHMVTANQHRVNDRWWLAIQVVFPVAVDDCSANLKTFHP